LLSDDFENLLGSYQEVWRCTGRYSGVRQP